VSYYEAGERISVTRGEDDEYKWKNLDLAGGMRDPGEVKYGTMTPDGYGIEFEASGGIYVGQLEDGTRQGLGIYMDRYHNSVSGVWVDGVVAQVSRILYVDESHSLDWLFPADEDEDIAILAFPTDAGVAPLAFDADGGILAAVGVDVSVTSLIPE